MMCVQQTKYIGSTFCLSTTMLNTPKEILASVMYLLQQASSSLFINIVTLTKMESLDLIRNQKFKTSPKTENNNHLRRSSQIWSVTLVSRTSSSMGDFPKMLKAPWEYNMYIFGFFTLHIRHLCRYTYID